MLVSGGLFRSLGIIRSDLIIFGVLVSLGFAFTENIIYLISAGSDILQTVSLSISRGITGFLFHSIFTGSICLMFTLAGSSLFSKIIHLIAGSMLGIGLHLIYNLILGGGVMGRFLIYLCIGYVFLTYLMWKSDRVYI